MGKETEIGRGNKRKVQKKKARRNRFGKERQETFLGHFAVTCNATASARKAGVGQSTVYMRRTYDPDFSARYDMALAQGYATLEAEMVRRAKEALRTPIKTDPEELANVARMDPKVALALLQLHRKGLERGIGNTRPRRSDIEHARARLEKRMRALGLISNGDKKDVSTASPRKGAKDGPANAARPASPANPEEDEGPSTSSPSGGPERSPRKRRG